RRRQPPGAHGPAAPCPAFAPDTAPCCVVLVDGRVAATWSSGTVVVAPLRRLSRADRTTVAEEGRDFLSDGESHRVRIAASP
ncbi:hypothetical protein ACFFNX_47390, partial [Actinoallomurus acaciae]